MPRTSMWVIVYSSGHIAPPVHYRVRYVAYCAGHPEYWRVQIEALEPVPVEAPKKVES